jgi:hypothetical protein
LDLCRQCVFSIVLVLADIAAYLQLAFPNRFHNFQFDILYHGQHSPQLLQILLKIPSIPLLPVLTLEDAIGWRPHFIDLLHSALHPSVEIEDLIDMSVGIFPSAAIAQIGILLAVDLAAEELGLFLVEFADLLDGFVYVAHFVGEGQFLALHLQDSIDVFGDYIYGSVIVYKNC